MGEGEQDGYGGMLLGFSFMAWIAAGYFLWVGYSVEVIVPVDGMPTGVANTHAMHIQGMNIMIGAAAAIIGSVFGAAAGIVMSIRAPRP